MPLGLPVLRVQLGRQAGLRALLALAGQPALPVRSAQRALAQAEPQVQPAQSAPRGRAAGLPDLPVRPEPLAHKEPLEPLVRAER